MILISLPMDEAWTRLECVEEHSGLALAQVRSCRLEMEELMPRNFQFRFASKDLLFDFANFALASLCSRSCSFLADAPTRFAAEKAIIALPFSGNLPLDHFSSAREPLAPKDVRVDPTADAELAVVSAPPRKCFADAPHWSSNERLR